MKPDTAATKSLFKTHKSYTPEEVFAAGGPTLFGLKTGFNNETLIKALENTAPIEPFTQEEWDEVISDLANNK